MKRIFCLLVTTGLLAAEANAQVTENFNTRNGVALTQLKGYLQTHCFVGELIEVWQGEQRQLIKLSKQ